MFSVFLNTCIGHRTAIQPVYQEVSLKTSEIWQHSGVLWSTKAYIFSKCMLLMHIPFMFFLTGLKPTCNLNEMESQLKFLNKARTNTSNLFYSLSQCRKFSTCLLKSSAKRRCRLCFPSGIRSNLKRRKKKSNAEYAFHSVSIDN